MTPRAKTWRQPRRWTAAESSLAAAQSELLVERSRLIHDQALFAYARITAPFAGVVTQRYANLWNLDAGRHELQHPGHAPGQVIPG